MHRAGKKKIIIKTRVLRKSALEEPADNNTGFFQLDLILIALSMIELFFFVRVCRLIESCQHVVKYLLSIDNLAGQAAPMCSSFSVEVQCATCSGEIFCLLVLAVYWDNLPNVPLCICFH